MKRLRYVRHSDKMDWNGHLVIHQAGLDRIQKEISEIVPKGLTDIFHGLEIRTAQTALAIVANSRVLAHVYEPIEEVGTDKLFDEMYTEEVEELLEDLEDLEAFKQVHGSDQFKMWQIKAAKGVVKMFSLIEDNGYGLCCGHEPIISLVASEFGQTNEQCLETLEFIDFVQMDDGTIKVE